MALFQFSFCPDRLTPLTSSSPGPKTLPWFPSSCLCCHLHSFPGMLHQLFWTLINDFQRCWWDCCFCPWSGHCDAFLLTPFAFRRSWTCGDFPEPWHTWHPVTRTYRTLRPVIQLCEILLPSCAIIPVGWAQYTGYICKYVYGSPIQLLIALLTACV